MDSYSSEWGETSHTRPVYYRISVFLPATIVSVSLSIYVRSTKIFVSSLDALNSIYLQTQLCVTTLENLTFFFGISTAKSLSSIRMIFVFSVIIVIFEIFSSSAIFAFNLLIFLFYLFCLFPFPLLLPDFCLGYFFQVARIILW